MFSTSKATASNTIVNQELATYNSSKENLNKALDSLDTAIKGLSGKKISHDEAILILEKSSDTYKNKFLPFHTAARNIQLESTNAENEFNDMKKRLEGQFQKVSAIWETHKKKRNIGESFKYRFIGNDTKNEFKTYSALLQKSSIASIPPTRSYSYHHSSNSFFGGSDFLLPFLLGAVFF